LEFFFLHLEDGILFPSPGRYWSYGEYMAFKGGIVGAAINIYIQPTPAPHKITIYAANYRTTVAPFRQEIGTYSGTSGDVGSLYYDAVNNNSGFFSRLGLLTPAPLPLSPGIINFSYDEYIGIFVENHGSPGDPVLCAIEGTLYLQTI
jgi:hypothetical protein